MTTQTPWQRLKAWLSLILDHAQANTLPEAPVEGGPSVPLSNTGSAATNDITIVDQCFGQSAKVQAAFKAIQAQYPKYQPPVNYLFEGMLHYLQGANLVQANWQMDNRFPLIAGAPFDPADMAKDCWPPQIVSVVDNPAKSDYPINAPERYILTMGKDGQSGVIGNYIVFGRNYKTPEQVIAYLNTLYPL